MARVLLILPTSTYRATDFLDAATSLGVEVSVAAEEPLPLLDPDRFLAIDCQQPEAAALAIVELAGRTPIDAIVPVDDSGVIIAALAGEMLGLAHNRPDAARATRDKHRMRELLASAEVPQPRFALAGDDASDLIGFPLVAKPLDRSGSFGVIKVEEKVHLAAVIERIHSLAGEGPVLLEQFLSGPEVAVEGMLSEGDLEVLAVFDKPLPLEGPYFEETIYVTPSRHAEEVQREVARVTQAASRGIGLEHGPIHAELRLVAGLEPKLIEIAARSIGGICGRSLSFGLLDTPLETLILRQALGQHRRLPSRNRASGVLMIPIPGAGTLVEVKGVDQVKELPGVTEVEISAPIGAELRPVPEADRYLGFVFARASEPEEVERVLRRALTLLEVVLD